MAVAVVALHMHATITAVKLQVLLALVAAAGDQAKLIALAARRGLLLAVSVALSRLVMLVAQVRHLPLLAQLHAPPLRQERAEQHRAALAGLAVIGEQAALVVVRPPHQAITLDPVPVEVLEELVVQLQEIATLLILQQEHD